MKKEIEFGMQNITADDIKTKEDVEAIQNHWERYADDYTKMFAKSINVSMDYLNKQASTGIYNPPEGTDFLNEVNSSTRIPTQSELTRWLRNAEYYEKNLRDASKGFTHQIMQYRRTRDHFARQLTFFNDMRYGNYPDVSDKDAVTTWQNSRKKCLRFFEKFNHHYNFKALVMPKLVEEGGFFGYLQEEDHFAKLLEMPTDFCYITGRWDWGFTYAVDLTFFDRFVYLRESVPELYAQYEEFVRMRELGLSGRSLAPYQYYPIPVEKGYVFSFDPLRAQILPPLQGTFKDALAILDYKNLLRQKTTLDTWKVVAQIIPRDKENKPAIDIPTAQLIVQATQSIMPSGVITFATPMDVEEVNFNNTQNQNNITGLGEQLFWRSIGVNGSLMDAGDKSAMALKYSLINDATFVDHTYMQFENFINLQFLLRSREYRFAVKFYGNRYTEADDSDRVMKQVVSANMPVGRLFGMAGYDMHQVDGAIMCEEVILGWKDNMKAILAGAQMSGKDEGGRQEKNVEELSDAGMDTRDRDTNNSSRG